MATTASQRQVTVAQAMHTMMVIDIHTTLNELLRKINWNDYSCLAVMDDEKKVFGMITEHDIQYAQKKQLNFQTTRAWEIASNVFHKVTPDTTLQDAIEIMIEHRVRHLIVENNDEIKGIITPLDILSLIKRDEPENNTVPDFSI